VVAAIVLGASTVEEIKKATGLATRDIGRALSRLVDADLVIRDDEGRHWLVEERFRQAAIETASDDDNTDVFDVPEDASRVLRAFIRDGRLVSIPAAHSKRRIVLDYLAQEFEPGRRYHERRVNDILGRWHDDVASLRRYLVDEGFLEREGGGGEYWRVGGSVAIGGPPRS
jgi:hypothetical protein